MATRKYYDAKTVFLFIKRTNKPTTPDTNFRTVACLDSTGFSGTKELKTVTNKCTGGWQEGVSGDGSWTMSMSGQAVSDTLVASEIGFQELLEMFVAGEEFEAKVANADGSVYRGGTAVLTAYEETANSTDPYSFTGTLTGLGTPIIKKPATT